MLTTGAEKVEVSIGQGPMEAPSRESRATAPDVSVIIAAFDIARWALLERAVMSAAAQSMKPQVVIAIDNNAELLTRATAEFQGVTVVLNTGDRGASATRNVGAAAASGRVLAFLDDDAEASETWLALLVEPLDVDPTVVGVGGGVNPSWSAVQPRWFPLEFGWVVGASYTGLPTQPAAVRNVWSENMAVLASDFHSVGGFREGFGKVGESSRPEDTDFCLRLQSQHTGRRWWYVPDALVSHHVPEARATLTFFLRRCFAEGRGKAGLAGHVGSAEALSTERSYVARILSRGILRGLSQTARGDLGGLQRAAAIGMGAGMAAVGYVVEVSTLARAKN
jgi:GT2 family glycosyltransferase